MDVREDFFPGRVVRHGSRLPGESGGITVPEVFRRQVSVALGDMV